MKQLFAPNGLHIVGTAEIILGTATVEGWDHEGNPIYTGHTDIDWNDQFTESNYDHTADSDQDRSIYVIDEMGGKHLFKDCAFDIYSDE